MTARDLAALHEAKIFESRADAEKAGYVLTETLSPRNAWNKASAAQALLYPLVARKRRGEIEKIGLILEPHSVTGCYVPVSAESAKE
jgi:hypothetical protein